jgi:DNA-binding response OmpR family regulator
VPPLRLRRILPREATIQIPSMPTNTPVSPDAPDIDVRPTHLLVVDDDAEIARLLVRYFGTHGFRVSCAGDGAQMRRLLAAETVDIVLLDLGLPGEDGLALTHYLREHWHGPVIIITGRGDTVDRVVGLELGADDYVAKPFDLRELLARVRSVLRRTGEPAASPAPGAAPSAYVFEDHVLDTRAHALSAPDGRDIPLTSGEFALLRAFVEQAGQVVSRDQLMTRLHGRDAGPFDRSIDVQIGRLRKKIEADPAQPKFIKSIRGAGYLFAAQVRPA